MERWEEGILPVSIKMVWARKNKPVALNFGATRSLIGQGAD